MQSAHHVVAFDDAELGEISTSVRALSLHDEVTKLDLVGEFLLSTGPPTGFILCSPNALDRQALEEVVEEFIELPFSPSREATTEEEGIGPVHTPFRDYFLEEWPRNGEAITEVFT